MSKPCRTRVVLLDPVKTRRSEAEEGLRARFDVTALDAAPAVDAARALAAQAVVISVRQTEGNGLTAARVMRDAMGVDVLIIVVGPADEAMSNERRAQLTQRHGVDLWIPRPVDPHTLQILLTGELSKRGSGRKKTDPVVVTPGAPEPHWSDVFGSASATISLRRFFARPARQP